MSAALGELVVTGVQKFGPPHVLCYYSAEPVFASSQGNIATVQNSGHNDSPGESRLYFLTEQVRIQLICFILHVRVSKKIENLVFFSFYHETHVSQENWL
jgi:hypothetical protein